MIVGVLQPSVKDFRRAFVAGKSVRPEPERTLMINRDHIIDSIQRRVSPLTARHPAA
jgi:hypothetical protein